MCDEHQLHEILQDPSILNTVYWNKKPAVIRDEEIVVMQYLLYGGDEEGIQLDFVVQIPARMARLET